MINYEDVDSCWFTCIREEAIQLNISGSLTFAGEVVGRLSDLDHPGSPGPHSTLPPLRRRFKRLRCIPCPAKLSQCIRRRRWASSLGFLDHPGSTYIYWVYLLSISICIKCINLYLFLICRNSPEITDWTICCSVTRKFPACVWREVRAVDQFDIIWHIWHNLPL